MNAALSVSADDISGFNGQTSLLPTLQTDGFILLSTRDFDVEQFSALIKPLVKRLTFDPARDFASDAAQTVDAGTDAVGLHIENGNTPMPPDLVSFYSAKSASVGAQTTVSDGVAILQRMSAALKEAFAKPFTMTRYLPKAIWQRYVATAFGIDNPDTVDKVLLDRFIGGIPGQSYTEAQEGGIDYCLAIPAIRADNLAAKPAFANALLGPSYNYQTPIYRFADGSVISDAIIEELNAIGEEHTREIQWQDGDIAIIDNKRVMHGRRQITVPLSERKLFIAMGLEPSFSNNPTRTSV